MTKTKNQKPVGIQTCDTCGNVDICAWMFNMQTGTYEWVCQDCHSG